MTEDIYTQQLKMNNTGIQDHILERLILVRLTSDNFNQILHNISAPLLLTLNKFQTIF